MCSDIFKRPILEASDLTEEEAQKGFNFLQKKLRRQHDTRNYPRQTGIDVSTVEQGDEAWAKLRLGVITASEVHNVISKPRSGTKWTGMKMSYFHTLLAEVCTGVAPEVNAKALARESSTRKTPAPSSSSPPT